MFRPIGSIKQNENKYEINQASFRLIKSTHQICLGTYWFRCGSFGIGLRVHYLLNQKMKLIKLWGIYHRDKTKIFWGFGDWTYCWGYWRRVSNVKLCLRDLELKQQWLVCLFLCNCTSYIYHTLPITFSHPDLCIVKVLWRCLQSSGEFFLILLSD